MPEPHAAADNVPRVARLGEMDVKDAQTKAMPRLQAVHDLGSEENEGKGGREMIGRLLWRLRNLREGYHELNRRAKVEAELFECVSGKRPMPDKQKLREWAVRLGVPEAFRQQHADAMELLQSKLALLMRENRRLSDELKKADDAVEQARADERAKVLREVPVQSLSAGLDLLNGILDRNGKWNPSYHAWLLSHVEAIRRLIDTARAAQEKT